MLKTLPQLNRRNAPWTPFQRRTWLATRRRRLPAVMPPALPPAPVLNAAIPGLLQWDWALTNPYQWNVWQSSDGGDNFNLFDGCWTSGDARQFTPEAASRLFLIVGVDIYGNEITARSNVVWLANGPDPNDAQMVSGYDGQMDANNNVLNLVAAGPGALLYGTGYISDWTCADGSVVPHCIVSNRVNGYMYSDSFPLPNGGSKGTVAAKILLPADGNFRGLCFFWAPYGNWGMSMLMIGSGAVNGGADECLFVQTPKGDYFTSVVMFPNDGNFHWLIYRWDMDAGFFEVSVDGLAETVALVGYEDGSYDWGDVMNFQSIPLSESATCINVISHVSWWDRPLSDLQKTMLMSS